MKVINVNKVMTINEQVKCSYSVQFINNNGEWETMSVVSGEPMFDKVEQLVESFARGEVEQDVFLEKMVHAINPREAIEEKFKQIKGVLDGRLTIKGNHVYIDYDVVDPILERHILRLLDKGEDDKNKDWVAFARFLDNLYANTSSHVREQLFGWLMYQMEKEDGFTLTPDGCLLGYKGCMKDDNGDIVSVAEGDAIVDGKSYSGHIPNKIGSVVEMPRQNVQDDPSVGCSYGLHVGTYSYAKGWARGALLLVKVNPRDIVSVPTECEAQKVRACRYEVLEVTEVKWEEPTYGDWDDDDNWVNDDECCKYCDEHFDYCCCEYCDVCDEHLEECCCGDPERDDYYSHLGESTLGMALDYLDQYNNGEVEEPVKSSYQMWRESQVDVDEDSRVEDDVEAVEDDDKESRFNGFLGNIN